MWATANTELDFPISFLVEDDFVIPSTASAFVQDNLGAVVLPSTPLDTSSTSTVLKLPASITTISAEFGTLFVLVRFIANGQLHEQRHVINLVQFVPMTVGPEDVRRILGVPSTELPDNAVHIHPAYFRLRKSTPEIAAALTATDGSSLEANRAVALEATIELIPSLALRIGQKLKSEDQEFARFAGMDWQALEAKLEGELQSILDDLTVGDAPGISRFVWAFPTDPITGG